MICSLHISGRARSAVEERTKWTLSPDSLLWIEGMSTLHNYKCKACQFSGTFTMIDGTVTTMKAAQISIPVCGINCQINRMNRVLIEALRGDKNAVIRYTLREFETQEEWDSISILTAKGSLNIGGVKKEIEMTVRCEHLPNGNIRFFGIHELLMSDFGIERPTALLGALSASDLVTIHFDVTATPERS